MKHILPDGAALHYELHGNPKADQTFVFLNGFSQTTAAWAGVVFALSKPYRLLLVDLLNQGKSTTTPAVCTLEAHAAAIAGLLRVLELSKPIVVGISMGGAVAQRLLVQFPEAAVAGVLVSSFAQVDAYFDAVLQSWEKAVLAGGPPLLLDVMLPLVLGRSYFDKPFVVSLEHLKQNKVSQSLTSESLLQQILSIKTSKEFIPELRQVQVPVLLVHGQEDPLCPVRAAEVMAKAIPQAKLEVLPNAGHTLNLECIPDVSRLVDTFAKQLSSLN
ncbi:alpha/beta hydrolase [Pontibacter qinzhouensis]|uniref:Alpha/beta hydrolase n=1 Tax=Pontibacter qinzhouensis TaxID=2603253 RepID=A0A5C8KEG7_9BACT|nr:alpha/beta hydrolase [Pontibacter qinzhouensis]TXK51986.1 alpha/beta hydrolase [Pontibacter qinzhouensis]